MVILSESYGCLIINLNDMVIDENDTYKRRHIEWKGEHAFFLDPDGRGVDLAADCVAFYVPLAPPLCRVAVALQEHLDHFRRCMPELVSGASGPRTEGPPEMVRTRADCPYLRFVIPTSFRPGKVGVEHSDELGYKSIISVLRVVS